MHTPPLPRWQGYRCRRADSSTEASLSAFLSCALHQLPLCGALSKGASFSSAAWVQHKYASFLGKWVLQIPLLLFPKEEASVGGCVHLVGAQITPRPSCVARWTHPQCRPAPPHTGASSVREGRLLLICCAPTRAERPPTWGPRRQNSRHGCPMIVAEPSIAEFDGVCSSDASPTRTVRRPCRASRETVAASPQWAPTWSLGRRCRWHANDRLPPAPLKRAPTRHETGHTATRPANFWGHPSTEPTRVSRTVLGRVLIVISRCNLPGTLPTVLATAVPRSPDRLALVGGLVCGFLPKCFPQHLAFGQCLLRQTDLLVVEGQAFRGTRDEQL